MYQTDINGFIFIYLNYFKVFLKFQNQKQSANGEKKRKAVLFETEMMNILKNLSKML